MSRTSDPAMIFSSFKESKLIKKKTKNKKTKIEST